MSATEPVEGEIVDVITVTITLDTSRWDDAYATAAAIDAEPHDPSTVPVGTVEQFGRYQAGAQQ